ncbi:MAG: N-acetylmuramoyl-L-alanine amidase, partial [Blautia coccoides]
MRINVHAGHNFKVPGAAGVFSETTEDRKVKDLVIRKLQAAGHTVYDCTDENSGSVSGNLAAIVEKCNAHAVDLDVSIHFNCYNSQAHGTEVFIYNWGTAAEPYAQRIVDKIGELGYTKRGVKTNSSLYVLRHTASPALLVECCFCDSAEDAGKYTAEKMANAIVSGITGSAMSGNAPSGDTKDWLSRGDTGAEVTEWQKKLNIFGSGVNVDGEFGPDTETQT